MLWMAEECVRNSWTPETPVQQVWSGVGLERAQEQLFVHLYNHKTTVQDAAC